MEVTVTAMAAIAHTGWGSPVVAMGMPLPLKAWTPRPW